MTDAGGSWRARYEAGAERDRAGNAAEVQRRFGGPFHRTVFRELPMALALLVLGGLLISWTWGVVSAVVLLAVVLVYRWWARRRYGVTGERPADPA